MSQISPEIEPDAFDRPSAAGMPQDDERFSVPEVRMGRRPFARELLETILLTLAIFIAVRFVVQNFVVEGHSMDPTLHDNQMLLVNKAAYFQWDSNFLERLNPFGTQPDPAPRYLFGAPQRGDIVVFHAPNDAQHRDFIKRVIAVPPERVRIKAGDGVYVNDIKLDEPYIKELAEYDWPAGTEETAVPPDQLFVLGDNRNNSDDSHEFGFIKTDSVVGRAWFTYWPREEIGPLPHPEYSK